MKTPVINKSQPVLIFSKSLGTMNAVSNQDILINTYNTDTPNKGIWVDKVTVENVHDLNDINLYTIHGTKPHREENEKKQVLSQYPFKKNADSYTVEINKFLRQVNGEGWNDIILQLSSSNDAPFQAQFHYEVVRDSLDRFYLSHNNTCCEFADTVNPVFRSKGIILERMKIETEHLNEIKLLVHRGDTLIMQIPLIEFIHQQMGDHLFQIDLKMDVSHAELNQWKDITIKLEGAATSQFKAEVCFTTVPNSFEN